MSIKGFVLCVALNVLGLALVGCNGAADKPSEKGAKAAPAASVPAPDGPKHEHEGWWCEEHGVPEAVCAQCSTKLAADYKAKGDWCKEHDRPESQCFLCHPE